MSQLAKELEETKHNHRYWEVQRLLRKIEPNGSTLQLLDSHGITSNHLLKLNNLVRHLYEKFFNPLERETIQPWEREAKPLTDPFTEEEMQAAIAKLRNRRACGEDQIFAEHLNMVEKA